MPIQLLNRQEGTYPSKRAAKAGNMQGVASILGQAIQGYQKRSEGERLRQAAGTALGVPPDSLRGLSNEQLEKVSSEAAMEKFKSQISPKEWKPTTKEEAIDFEQAKGKGSLREKYGPEAQKFEAGKALRKRLGRIDEVPEGFEIAGYSAEGAPSIRKIKAPKEETYTDAFRNDFRDAASVKDQIMALPISGGEKRKRIQELKRRLVNEYPDKALDIGEVLK